MKHNAFSTTCLLLSGGLMTACGGGGGSSGGSTTPPSNLAPVFASPADVTSSENLANDVYQARATDPEGAAIAYALGAGGDSALFKIDAATGILSFISAPDFEHPADGNTNNIYDVTVTATDGVNPVSQLVHLKVSDALACQAPDPAAPPVEFTSTVCDTAAVFYTRGGAIRASTGQVFTARGVNLQYGDNPSAALPAVAAISSVNANMIRLQLRRDTSAADLRAALDAALAVKMPVMVMYWESDITCASNAAVLKADTNNLWLNRWAPVLLEAKYQPYLMLNLANEWGNSNNSYNDYLNTYKSLIVAMRAKGFRNPLVIDAADCGQATASFTAGRGQALVDADPLKNLIVSVHAYYDDWHTPAKADQHMDDLMASGVPFLIGEFGDSQLDAPSHNIDHMALMHSAQMKGVGWLAWSWKGNGAGYTVLDMSTQYGTASLTRRGQDVVNGADGLAATSVKPSY